MARTSPSEARLRLFVALELPEGFRGELGAWCDGVLSGFDSVRLVPAEQLHVTLAFLGSRGEGEVDAIAACVRGSCASFSAAVEMNSGAMKGVPPKRPRLIALDLEDSSGDCARLQRAVSDDLAAGGFYEPEERPFWPHVTLARVRKGQRPPSFDSVPDPPRGPFSAPAVTLYRSLTRPSGAVYEPLERVELVR